MSPRVSSQRRTTYRVLAQVRDWHKGELPEVAPATPSPRLSSARRHPYSWSGASAATASTGVGRFGGRGSLSSQQQLRSGALLSAHHGGGGGGRASPSQGAFSDDDDMMDDDDDGCGGSGGRGSWDGNGGSSRSGAVSASQISATQGGGGGGGGGGAGIGRGVGSDQRMFGEGEDPGGALKGSMVWCSRLSLAISPYPSTARRLCRIFEQVRTSV